MPLAMLSLAYQTLTALLVLPSLTSAALVVVRHLLRVVADDVRPGAGAVERVIIPKLDTDQARPAHYVVDQVVRTERPARRLRARRAAGHSVEGIALPRDPTTARAVLVRAGHRAVIVPAQALGQEVPGNRDVLAPWWKLCASSAAQAKLLWSSTMLRTRSNVTPSMHWRLKLALLRLKPGRQRTCRMITSRTAHP